MAASIRQVDWRAGKIIKEVIMAVKRYRRDFPLVVFLTMMRSIWSIFDPKEPKSSALQQSVGLARFAPGKFDTEISSLINPRGKREFKSPYFDSGEDELKKQIVNSILLSTRQIPSRRFCFFAEKYLIPGRLEYSFAKAIGVSRLVKRTLESEYTHRDNWSVLSVGCRDSIEIAFLKRYFQHLPGLKVTGMDISALNGDIVQGDMHSMPFEEDMFDIIISSHSFEHCLEPELVVSEFKRVATPNAFIGIEVPARNTDGTKPIRIEDGADNWDFCNPSVISDVFGEDIEMLTQETASSVLRVVMKAS